MLKNSSNTSVIPTAIRMVEREGIHNSGIKSKVKMHK